MNYLPTLALTLLLTLTNIGAVAHAEVVKTGSTFFIPVHFERGPESINVIEGSLRIPSGITVEHIDTTDSSLNVFANGPIHDLSQGTIEFTGGTPEGISETNGLLFTIQARADAEGIYTIIPASVSAFEHNGEGTQVGITVPAVTVTVRDDGSVEATPTTNRSTELVTAIGKEDSLFEGKWFVTFYGGAKGSPVDHYEVKEGWFGNSVPAERYHVLRDQSRSATLWVTAVGENQETVTAHIPPARPWPERFLLVGIVLIVLAGGAVLYMKIIRRKRAP